MRHEPIKAKLYVQSDKLAKLARFLTERGQVSGVLLTDQISNHKETRVR